MVMQMTGQATTAANGDITRTYDLTSSRDGLLLNGMPLLPPAAPAPVAKK
jgi:hypothetical protein